MSSIFRAAAFRGTNGTVYETGSCHDAGALPAEVVVDAEGFVSHDGQFFTRAEATDRMRLDHAVQSQELDMQKSEGITFEFRRHATMWLQKNEFSIVADGVDSVRTRAAVIRAQAGHRASRDAWDIAAAMARHAADPELAEEARQKYGDDDARVALHAHGLDADDDSLVMAIRAQLAAARVEKSELNVAVIPRVVRAAQPGEGAQRVAAAVQKAFGRHLVYEVHLGGKHSGGAAVAYDEDADSFWLLKPGSGPLSPSAGVRDTRVSQSRREVGFSQAAAAISGLRGFVPRAELLTLDGHEVACIEVLPEDFVPMQKITEASQDLQRYVESGAIWRWALLDYVLGNPDRHSGNIMMTPDGRVALIDHGSTLAGVGFDPGGDRNSYVPAYLRVFRGLDWRLATPEQKLRALPQPTADAQQVFAAWLRSASQDTGWEQVLAELAPEALPACRQRWQRLAAARNPLLALLRAWVGLDFEPRH